MLRGGDAEKDRAMFCQRVAAGRRFPACPSAGRSRGNKSEPLWPSLVLALFGAIEVIGGEQIFLLRDRLGGNRGRLWRIRGEGVAVMMHARA